MVCRRVKTWGKLVSKVTADESPLPARCHRLATLSLGTLFVGTFVGVFLKICFVIGKIGDDMQQKRAEFYGYANSGNYANSSG